VPASNPEGTPATLGYVFDGDSIEVKIDGETAEVRLIGVNAPEGDECFGDRSRAALVAALESADLVLVAGSDGDTDRYGRLLRYVYVDGENVNGQMLADGNAVALQGDHRYNAAFVEIGDLAAAGRAGMWAPDACGASPTAGISIVEVEHNPPGPDDEHLNDEYVTIASESAGGISLTEWILRDESSQNRYRFGDIVLNRGDQITVRSGCGTDTANTVYWCAERSVWSNSGDTVILQIPSGNVVDRWRYGGDR
jgi:micrococcal nuclease